MNYFLRQQRPHIKFKIFFIPVAIEVLHNVCKLQDSFGSGLGEAFARRFHAWGKKVIAAGRRMERLETLKSQLKGLETFQVYQRETSNKDSG
jgi:hypothetical protein